MVFSRFRLVKNKFRHFWPPLEKRLEKFTSAPTGKNPSDAHAHNKHVKLRHFFVLHHIVTLFNNTNAVSKPSQGDRLCTVYSAKQLRNPAKFTAK